MLACINRVLNFHSYMAQIDRLFSPSYMPNDQDVLLSRLRTTGITEEFFEFGKLSVHVLDVGGSRSERKKWVHAFEGSPSLLFVASLSGYDQCLIEDKTGVCNTSLIYTLIYPAVNFVYTYTNHSVSRIRCKRHSCYLKACYL